MDSTTTTTINKEGFTTSTMHSFPFINDGPKFVVNNDNTTQQTNNNMDIQVPPGVIHIKPAWKPVKLDEKPPFSYATIIAHAILSSQHRKLTLSEIYQWITKQYPCYSMKDHRWQNSIRHNLSLQKAFVKLERNILAIGKGCYWTIVSGYEQHFIDNLVKKGCVSAITASGSSSGEDKQQQPNNTTIYKYDTTSVATVENKRTNHSHLFTIFRMNPTTITTTTEEERRTKRKKVTANKTTTNKKSEAAIVAPPVTTTGYDSDCDSGVDLTPNNNNIYFMQEYSSSATSLLTTTLTQAKEEEEEEEEENNFDHFSTSLLFTPPAPPPPPLPPQQQQLDCMYWPITPQQQHYTTTDDFSTTNYFHDTTAAAHLMNLEAVSFDYYSSSSTTTTTTATDENFFLNSSSLAYPTPSNDSTCSFFFL